MERYLKNEQMTPTSERKSSRSWTSFLSGVEQRPSSLSLQSAAGGGGLQSAGLAQMLPASFTLHRHCSTPSPTASSSPFSLASPSSVGATTPDDDGTNPVDSLCQLVIDRVGGESRCPGSGNADVVSSSSSSCTSWDSTRSDHDLPIRGPSTRGGLGAAAVRQRYVRRPTELSLTPGTPHRTTACREVGVDPQPRYAANRNAACFRRIAKRRQRSTALGHDEVTASGPTSPSVVRHHVSPTRPTSLPVGAGRTRWPPSHQPPSPPTAKLPPLPSPAEVAYLRSLSGATNSRTINQDVVKRPSESSSLRGGGGGGVQRSASAAERTCQPPSASLTTSLTPAPDNSRLEATNDPAAGSDGRKQMRLYGCSVVECGKLYSKSSHLKAHMRSHTGITGVCQVLV